MFYRLAFMVDAKQEMDWKRYGFSIILFSALGFLLVYPAAAAAGRPAAEPGGPAGHQLRPGLQHGASFTSNTNWQAYGGETTLSYLTQMLGLTVQNFVSAAVGIVVVIVLIRGFARRSHD